MIYPGVTALDLVGPHEVFTAAAEVARRTGGEPDAYRVEVAAADGRPVRTTRGLTVVADRSLASVRGPIDTLVVVGGEGAGPRRPDGALVGWVRARRAPQPPGRVGVQRRVRARRRRRARRPARDDALERVRRARPALPARHASTPIRSSCATATSGRRPVSPRAWTSRSRSSRTICGRDVALATARQLVLFVQRPGGQSQFSAQLGAQVAERDPLRDLQAWIAEHPDDDLSVERLAARVAMSPRHFARVFRDEVGMHPRGVRRVGARRGRAPAARDRPASASATSRARPASARSRRCAARSPAASASVPSSIETASAPGGRASRSTRRTLVDIASHLRRLTALDAIGPYEVLQRLPGAEVSSSSAPNAGRSAPTRACSVSSPTSRATT